MLLGGGLDFHCTGIDLVRVGVRIDCRQTDNV